MATNKGGKEEWLPQNRETEGTRTEAIERKAITAKNKARLNTQRRKQGQKWRKQDGHSKEKVG